MRLWDSLQGKPNAADAVQATGDAEIDRLAHALAVLEQRQASDHERLDRALGRLVTRLDRLEEQRQ